MMALPEYHTMELDMLEYIANSAMCWPTTSSKKLVHALRTSLGDNALNALRRHLHEATKREWLAYAKRVKASKRVDADKLALLDKHAADLTSYQIEGVKRCERAGRRRAILPPGKALVEELARWRESLGLHRNARSNSNECV